MMLCTHVVEVDCAELCVAVPCGAVRWNFNYVRTTLRYGSGRSLPRIRGRLGNNKVSTRWTENKNGLGLVWMGSNLACRSNAYTVSLRLLAEQLGSFGRGSKYMYTRSMIFYPCALGTRYVTLLNRGSQCVLSYRHRVSSGLGRQAYTTLLPKQQELVLVDPDLLFLGSQEETGSSIVKATPFHPTLPQPNHNNPFVSSMANWHVSLTASQRYDNIQKM